MEEITITTQSPKEVIDVTPLINNLIAKKKIESGICTVFIKHTTCALTTGEFEVGLNADFLEALTKIFPQGNWRHAHNPGHAGEHIISSIIGQDVTLQIQDNRLVLGDWQSLLLVELSGPRQRQLSIQFIKLEEKV